MKIGLTVEKLLVKPKGDDTVLECLDKRIQILSSFNRLEDACKDVVHTNDEHNLLTKKDITKLRQQSMILASACIHTRDNMDKEGWT